MDVRASKPLTRPGRALALAVPGAPRGVSRREGASGAVLSRGNAQQCELSYRHIKGVSESEEIHIIMA